MPITIRPARTPSDLRTATALVLAYADALGVDLAFQDFATEIADLGKKYAPPGGEILLAVDDATPSTTGLDGDDEDGVEDEKVLGCVAVRPLPSSGDGVGGRVCEVKRLYVRPCARGRGVGNALMNAAMSLARERGYAEMRLDTRRDMYGPRKMYAALGFEEMEPYYEVEEGIREGMVFFGRRVS